MNKKINCEGWIRQESSWSLPWVIFFISAWASAKLISIPWNKCGTCTRTYYSAEMKIHLNKFFNPFRRVCKMRRLLFLQMKLQKGCERILLISHLICILYTRTQRKKGWWWWKKCVPQPSPHAGRVWDAFRGVVVGIVDGLEWELIIHSKK